MRIAIISFIILFGLGFTPVLAQIDGSTFGSPEPSIELNPQFPKPGERVTATFNDFSDDSFGSSVSWVLNGIKLVDFENQREVVFNAAENGLEQTLLVILNKPSGGQTTIEKSFTPLYLDVIIEPQTHVPGFYMGRPLPSIGSTVNATALVGDNDLNSSNLMYLWKINQKVIGGGVLRGGHKVSYKTPRGFNSTLYLDVSTLDGTKIASRAILIPSVEPSILFYEVSSLFGIKNRPVDNNLNLVGNSTIIRAEPFNLDSSVYNNPDISIWNIDNNDVNNTGPNPYEVTLQRGLDSGVSNLNFHVRDLEQVLQGAKATVKINL